MKNKLIGMSFLFSLSPLLTFANSLGGENWNGHIGNGWGNGIGFIGGGWMMFIWIGFAILTIVTISRWLFSPKNKPIVVDNAQSILAERYARGEISQEEFIKMKKELRLYNSP